MFFIYNDQRKVNNTSEIFFIEAQDAKNMKYAYSERIILDLDDSSTINVAKNSYYIHILKRIPKNFTISTSTSSTLFNLDLLKASSETIKSFVKENPNTMQYFLPMDDKFDVLTKFSQLYNGDTVSFQENEIHAITTILKYLNIENVPICMKKKCKNRTQKLNSGIQIDHLNFRFWLRQNRFQTFTIATKQKEYKCNSYTVFLSDVISDLINKNNQLKRYEYDFDDENCEFQLICDIFKIRKN